MSEAQAEATAIHDHDALPRASSPPLPILPERKHLVTRHDENGATITFLNRARDLSVPVEWRPEDMRQGQLLWVLNLNYHEFLEALPDKLASRFVLDWIDQSRPYRRGYFLDDWNSYTLSIRVVVWMQRLAAGKLPLEPAEHERVHGSLIAQLRFLARNLELDVVGNHLLKNLKGLLWGASYFDGAEAERWRALGEHHLRHELKEQILSDGMHFELSPTYHNQVFCDLLDCYVCLRDGDFKTQLAETLADMAQVTTDFRHPDGGVSLFNDAGLYFAYQPAEALAAWQALFGELNNPSTLITYPRSGYYGQRSGDNLLLIDCAALAPDFLPAHGHGDALSFEWSVAGRRVFTDPGVFEYMPGSMRAYSRATTAHNTLSVGGEDQSEFWKSFRVGRRARITACRHSTTESGFTLVGAHDGYTRLEGAPIHQRAFQATADTLELVDTVTGGAGQPCTTTLLLHPDCTVELHSDTRATVRNGPATVEVETEAPMRLESASFHPDQGHHLDTQRLVTELGAASGALQHTTRITVQAPQAATD